MYRCIDIFVCMYTYIHVCIHTYLHTYILTYIHTYIHTYMYIYAYIHVHMYVFVQMRSMTWTHTVARKVGVFDIKLSGTVAGTQNAYITCTPTDVMLLPRPANCLLGGWRPKSLLKLATGLEPSLLLSS